MAAADVDTILNSDIIKQRIISLNQQLANKQLKAIDVQGDGNCFFRALSVSMYGHQNDHTKLRKAVARFMDIQAAEENHSLTDKEALRQRAVKISKDGEWVAEDIILATANYLKRPIHVYMAGACSPQVYSPSSSVTSESMPLMVAFYEPGHYRSVALQPVVSSSSSSYNYNPASSRRTSVTFFTRRNSRRPLTSD